MKSVELSVITASFQPVKAGRSEAFRRMAESVRGLGKLISVEHRIQDGASQDGSLELYRGAAPGSIVVSAPDGGIYDAMNRAAAAASGTYLSFLNTDDDYHDPAALAELVRELERTGADYGFAPIRRIRRDGSARTVPPKMYSIFARMPYCHQSLVVRRDVFESMGGYDTAFRIVADHDFALRLYLGGHPYVRGDRAFATFRSGGVSRDKERNHAERARIFRKLYPPCPGADFAAVAAGKSFPFSLFRRLQALAPAKDRPALWGWYLLRFLRFSGND